MYAKHLKPCRTRYPVKPKLGFLAISSFSLVVAALAVGGGLSAPGDEGDDNGAALSTGGGGEVELGTKTLWYLGSSAFLQQCAGKTLGCGKAVASVPDKTPYFSAPRTWPRSACNQWFSFRGNGKCVE